MQPIITPRKLTDTTSITEPRRTPSFILNNCLLHFSLYVFSAVYFLMAFSCDRIISSGCSAEERGRERPPHGARGLHTEMRVPGPADAPGKCELSSSSVAAVSDPGTSLQASVNGTTVLRAVEPGWVPRRAQASASPAHSHSTNAAPSPPFRARGKS